jgi:hypothetical protein
MPPCPLERTVEEIQEIAAAYRWRAVQLARGSFDVVEFWIENHLMLEPDDVRNGSRIPSLRTTNDTFP